MTERPQQRPADPTPAPAEGEWRRPGLTPLSLLLVLIAAFVLMKIQLVVVLVLLAILFATVIERPVMALHRRRVPRPLSILAVYVMIIGGIVLAGLLAAPLISNEAQRFRDEAPAQLQGFAGPVGARRQCGAQGTRRQRARSPAGRDRQPIEPVRGRDGRHRDGRRRRIDRAALRLRDGLLLPDRKGTAAADHHQSGQTGRAGSGRTRLGPGRGAGRPLAARANFCSVSSSARPRSSATG